jgi:hypothetical protein
MKNILPFVLLFLTVLSCCAQTTYKALLGLSTMEHLSTGIAVEGKKGQQLALLLGSNGFYKLRDFESVQLQYDRPLGKLSVVGCTPKWGIKGGYARFSDYYYRWDLLQCVPFVGLVMPFGKKWELGFDLGATFSYEIGLKRLMPGALGSYKRLLPEVKIGLAYTL